MTFEHLLAFNAALVAAVLSPGPALLVAIRTTLSAGRVSGIAIGFGLALMASAWTLIALLGLEAIFHVVPWLYGLTKIAGAVYLMFIAHQMWVGARKRLNTFARTPKNAFREGLLINLLNPKSVLFAAAVLVVVLPPELTHTEAAIVVLNHFVVEVIFYALLAIWMSTEAIRIRYLSARLYLDRASSIVLGALGIRLLTSR